MTEGAVFCLGWIALPAQTRPDGEIGCRRRTASDLKQLGQAAAIYHLLTERSTELASDLRWGDPSHNRRFRSIHYGLLADLS